MSMKLPHSNVNDGSIDRRDHFRLLLAILTDFRDRKVRELGDYMASAISGISERQMRSLRLKEKMTALPDEITVEIIHHILSTARPGDIVVTKFIMSVLDVFSTPDNINTQRLLKMFTISRDRGYNETAIIFISPEPRKKPFSKYDFVEGRDMDYVTLGEKRSMARTGVKDLLDRLIYDPNPMVVKSVLENPLLTERDILKMVSRRPNHDAVLYTIFRNEKWMSSYDVKLAMVKNPYTPVAIAMGLLFFLKRQDLRDISRDRSLHDLIKRSALGLMMRHG